MINIPPAAMTLAEKEKLLRDKQEMLRLKEGLPFLFGWKWYPWAKKFFDSQNKINLLCAANQISKSSTQIRKCIDWATNKKKWPDLWSHTPNQFWYLYPSQKQVNVEFETKWQQFLPRGEFKDDPIFGYVVERGHARAITAIHFNSGVHVYFKTYAQNASMLQSSTCDAIFCDEELPIELFDELMFRLTASSGYFHMAFTATMGQDFWRVAMSPGSAESENLPGAFKQVVSLYDSQHYIDGTKSQWTSERIKEVEARCSTEAEIRKRVLGEFILIGGRMYEGFDIKHHMKPEHPVPRGWFIFAGVDIGSGGPSGHPSGICFVAVRPDFRAGRVIVAWRGDGVITTSGDVVEKFIELKKQNKIICTAQYYDWANKDFSTIAGRMGECFEMADKSHAKGEDILNTLFKHDMLFLYDNDEIRKLAVELISMRNGRHKGRNKDDLIDALRYAVSKIPWDFSVINAESAVRDIDIDKPIRALNNREAQIDERRKRLVDDQKEEVRKIEDEFEEWNDAYG